MRNQDNIIITLFIVLYLLLVGFIIGYVLRATIKPKTDPAPSENEVLFRSDNHGNTLFFAINEERAKMEMGLLFYDYDLSEQALKDARNFNFTEDEAVYIIDDLEEDQEQAVLKIWLASSYKERFILNENIGKVGVISYYEEETRKRIYVAKFE